MQPAHDAAREAHRARQHLGRLRLGTERRRQDPARRHTEILGGEGGGTTALVNEAGLPAPAVGDVVVVGGRPGVVFERIDGPVRWDQMVAEPDHAARLCHLLARLQADVLAGWVAQKRMIRGLAMGAIK